MSSLLNWFKPASTEGGLERATVSLTESQDSSQSTTAESASVEQPVIESTADSDIPGESQMNVLGIPQVSPVKAVSSTSTLFLLNQTNPN